MSQETNATAGATPQEPPKKKPDQYLVQVRRVFESWEFPKMSTGKTLPDGSPEIVIVPKSNPVKVTKLVNGEFGPFRVLATAEQVAGGMAAMDSVISALVITIEDAPPEEKQVPASEEIVREMVARGQVPGVPADASVTVEKPENVVEFPSAPPATEE